jgi:hypothetical protein
MSDAENLIQDEQDDAHLQEELDFSFLNDAIEEDLSQPSEQEVQEVFSAPEEGNFDAEFESETPFAEAEETPFASETFAEAEAEWASVPEADVEEAWESSAAVESVAAPEPVAPVAPAAATAVDEFNLSTLNQLVDEIRQESERVAEMKASVVKALALIHEMSESLKS